jgi:hypothetical protein
LIANERKDRLALVAPIVTALGHEVIAREIEVKDVGAVTALERPDVALVGLERTKGILMERHSIDEAGAFEMLRNQSRVGNRKLIDLAAAVVDGYRLLPKQPPVLPES